MIDQALLIGNTRGMEAVVARLLSECRTARFYRTLGDLFENSPWPASLILVGQQWSDEFTPEEILQLLSSFPLSRIVVCQGPWCASDGRTRRDWPAAVCVPQERAVDRVEKELEVIAGRRGALPWTAGLDEIFAFDHGPHQPSATAKRV